MESLISLNNGETFISAEEALELVNLEDIKCVINTDWHAYFVTERKFKGGTDLEWLKLFLSIHGNLIIN